MERRMKTERRGCFERGSHHGVFLGILELDGPVDRLGCGTSIPLLKLQTVHGQLDWASA
jgi:hypothetical protein